MRHEPLEIWAPRWLVSLEGVLDVTTIATYKQYAKRLFPTIGMNVAAYDAAAVAHFARGRLQKVLRKTLRKELSALRQFLLFCKENEAIDALPEWPEFAQSVKGVRSGTQRAKAISVSPEQVATFLRALPEFSPIGQFPVRARFIVAYETGLRPATLSALEVGRHYTRGATHLTITEDIDKARYARRVPLSATAREALDRILPTKGPIFGDRKYRAAWERARIESRLPKGFAPYDLRHGLATHLLEASASLPGVGFLLGHTQATTTDKYIRGSERAGAAALASRGLRGEQLGDAKRRRPSGRRLLEFRQSKRRAKDGT